MKDNIKAVFNFIMVLVFWLGIIAVTFIGIGLGATIAP